MMAEKAETVEFAKALADSTRQKIMRICCCQWCTVSEIVAQMNLAQPTVSHHLAILRDAGLVEVRHEGKQSFYRLNQDRLSECCGAIMKRFNPAEEERQEWPAPDTKRAPQASKAEIPTNAKKEKE